MDGEESIEDLRAKLAEYHQQLVDVNGLLEGEPRNEEYIQIKKDLVDVISLTEDLVKLKETEETVSPPQKSYAPGPTSTLPANFFSVGTICEAKFSQDGIWYKAKINTILEGGKYHVTYTEYGNEEVVSITDIRPLTEVSKKSSSVTPLKRPAVPDTFQQIPKSLQVLPTDTDEERLRKRKKVKAIKSGNRLKTIEDEGKSKMNAWQSFQHKTQKAVPMSYTGKKKESIFKSPEAGGKIGVTGSGMSQFYFSFLYRFIFFVSFSFFFFSRAPAPLALSPTVPSSCLPAHTFSSLLADLL